MGTGCNLRFLYLREASLWPLGLPPLGPQHKLLGPAAPAHTDPHSSSCRVGVIYRAMQAGHSQGQTLASFTGRPRPGHTVPPQSKGPKGLGPLTLQEGELGHPETGLPMDSGCCLTSCIFCPAFPGPRTRPTHAS